MLIQVPQNKAPVRRRRLGRVSRGPAHGQGRGEPVLHPSGWSGARKTTKGQSTTGRSVVVEEKVDGANLGISINAQWRLRVQNRSTRSSTHKQFSTLDAWLEAHSSALFQVMEPERHVLFGEWLYAKGYLDSCRK